jgi:hypothetical protein
MFIYLPSAHCEQIDEFKHEIQPEEQDLHEFTSW